MGNFFRSKKFIIAAVAVLITAVVVVIRARGGGEELVIGKVERRDLKQTVLATGQVVSAVDLDLSMPSSGIVSQVNIKVGDKVRKGQVLVTLDQKDESASLTQARAGRASAQASYDKLVAGNSDPDIKVARAAVDAAETALDNAQAAYEAAVSEQRVLIDNAYKSLLNSGLAAIREGIFDSSFTATLSGTYTGIDEGEYKITLLSTGQGTFYYNVSGLEIDSRLITRGVALPLGAKGLYITFSTAGSMSAVDTWRVPIPNSQSSTYLDDLNGYLAARENQTETLTGLRNAINAAQSSLAQAEASLNLKLAGARQEDLAVAYAQVLSAHAQVQAAEAALEKTVLRAPADGTVTGVDVKVGELSETLSPVVVLQDVNNLHLEANVSEANIQDVVVGQNVEVTYDALGLEKKYAARVEFIDPASTVVSGIVNYKATFALDQLSEIKPGMTANLGIVTGERVGALAIPLRAVVVKNDGKYAQVIVGAKKKNIREQKIELGLEADGGYVEVTSGLEEGQEIVTLASRK
ncbi:MAG: efflux RND transporter periplasmic adaptor subunit [Candidatus Doudnabacteria bacterium]|nr:efflux RND transporter periplasmic adaptor subunit [Candidatus Doudnabacteria bacterium]